MMHVSNGNYYIVIKHRNHIETWSAYPIPISDANGISMNYDFSISANKAYGDNQSEIESGVCALYTGDVNQDENIDLIDASILDININYFLYGYLATDINGDGNVDLLDTPIVEGNINWFIYSVHP